MIEIPEAAPPFLRRGAPPRPQLSPRQARRIDRLSRRAHRFHRFAHHPLCGRYAGEVIRIGPRVRVCRGCALAVIGGGLGGLAAIIGRGVAMSPVAPIAAAGVALALLLPSVASKRRFPKLVTRLAPSALFAFAITHGVLAAHWLVAAGALAVVIALRLAYGRRGGDRSPCATCPERALEPCSGFAPIVRREQAFQRAVRRLIVVDPR
ncbi:MAG TPA: hypothetical protein VFP84_33200 [Kofleriaceae bacterium]|nr:hypothetical protein [Kofleriaceae bacterium]